MHEVLTQRGLDVVQLVRDPNRQIGFQNFLDFWKYFAPIALRVAFLHPEGDRDRLFILGLRVYYNSVPRGYQWRTCLQSLRSCEKNVIECKGS